MKVNYFVFIQNKKADFLIYTESTFLFVLLYTSVVKENMKLSPKNFKIPKKVTDISI